MKKVLSLKQNSLFLFLILFLLCTCLPVNVFSAGLVTNNNSGALIPKKQLPAGLEKMPKPKPSLQIQILKLETEPDGSWSYFFEIKNTGLTPLNLAEARFKAFQILDSNREIPIHEINYPTILPSGQTSRGKEPMNRCFNARQFRFEVWYQGQKLDTRTIQVPAMRAKIMNVKIDEQKKSWLADIKNLGSHALRVSAQPVLGASNINKVPYTQAAGTEYTQLIPGYGMAKFMGTLTTTSNIAGNLFIKAKYENPNCCPIRENVLDIMKTADNSLGTPDVLIENLTWNKTTRVWSASIKNQSNAGVSLIVTGYVLENAMPGTTIHTHLEIPANQSSYVSGNYSAFNLPQGTRLKVNVLLKPSNKLINSKVIVLN